MQIQTNPERLQAELAATRSKRALRVAVNDEFKLTNCAQYRVQLQRLTRAFNLLLRMRTCKQKLGANPEKTITVLRQIDIKA